VSLQCDANKGSTSYVHVMWFPVYQGLSRWVPMSIISKCPQRCPPSICNIQLHPITVWLLHQLAALLAVICFKRHCAHVLLCCRCGHTLLLAHAKAVQLYRLKYQPAQEGRISMAVSAHWGLPKDPQSAQGNTTEICMAARRSQCVARVLSISQFRAAAVCGCEGLTS
jgi:hypothetical protein